MAVERVVSDEVVQGALDQAVAALYPSFTTHPRATLARCCERCLPDGQVARLLQPERYGLNLHALRDWRQAAMPEEMSRAEVNWLLPRYLEALGKYGPLQLSPILADQALKPFVDAGFRKGLTTSQQDALHDWGDAYFNHSLHCKSPWPDPEGWGMGTEGFEADLCMLDFGGFDIERYLAALMRLKTAHLARIIAPELRATYHRPCYLHWTVGRGRSGMVAFWNNPDLLDRMTDAGLAGDDLAAEVSDHLAALAHFCSLT